MIKPCADKQAHDEYRYGDKIRCDTCGSEWTVISTMIYVDLKEISNLVIKYKSKSPGSPAHVHEWLALNEYIGDDKILEVDVEKEIMSYLKSLRQ